MKKPLLIAAVAALGLLSVAVGGSQALAARQTLAAQATCGATITVDTKLGGDLTNCPGDGIVIGADNITLDLNGHTIGGDAIPSATAFDSGVRNEGHDGVTIEGGTVRAFDGGVDVDGVSGNRIAGIVASNNGVVGILLISAEDNVVVKNTTSRNGQAGVAGFGAQHNEVGKNVISNNGFNGIFWSGSDENQITGNSVSDNSESGMIIDDSNRNAITGNHLFRNGDDMNVGADDNTITGNLVTDAVGCDDGEGGLGCGYGISVEGGARNLVARKIVARTARGAIRLDNYGRPVTGNVFRDNTVRESGGDGIAIDTDQAGPVLDTLLDGNVAIGATDDGIDVESPATTLTRNVAVRNGDLGIEAVPGVIDAGGNHAAGNGNQAQCTNVAC